MKMFDWDDQELANILWGGGGESDDHIVPYPRDTYMKDMTDYGDDDTEKLNEEDTNIKDAENNPTTSKLLSDEGLKDKNDGIFASGTITEAQPDSPSFGTSKIDDNPIAMKAELDVGPKVFGNQQNHKQLSELVDNSWANIACFDDLAQIFSNDELDGRTSLGNTDELWSPSKDLIKEEGMSSSAVLDSSWEFRTLGTTSSEIELDSEYLYKEYLSPAKSSEKTGNIIPSSKPITGVFVEQQEYAASPSALLDEKGDWTSVKQQQITDTVTDSALSEDVYSSWQLSAANIAHYDCVSTPTTAPNLTSWPIAYQHATHKCAAPNRKFPQKFPSHMLKSANGEHQSALASSEVCQGDGISFNKPVENNARPNKMTPQEKIEKLRRRQQMRAMLAIRKQQEQLSPQTSPVEFPLNRRSCQEELFLYMEKAESEDDEGLSNPGSAIIKGNLCTISDMEKPVDIILYQLQDIIKKLDTKTRLCIKDSLYRLAHSATQRHYASDISGTNRTSTFEPDIAKEEICCHSRIAEHVDVEAETNHIDRAVAHLLFHQPFKLPVKPAESPEPSTSKGIRSDQRISGHSPESSFLATEKNLYLPPDGPKTLEPFIDSCLKDMEDVSHTDINVNPQTEKMR